MLGAIGASSFSWEGRVSLFSHIIIEVLKILVQFLGLFVLLTIYGAMWSGAQDENQNGWVIALIWSISVVVAVNLLKILLPMVGA